MLPFKNYEIGNLGNPSGGICLTSFKIFSQLEVIAEHPFQFPSIIYQLILSFLGVCKGFWQGYWVGLRVVDWSCWLCSVAHFILRVSSCNHVSHCIHQCEWVHLLFYDNLCYTDNIIRADHKFEVLLLSKNWLLSFIYLLKFTFFFRFLARKVIRLSLTGRWCFPLNK